MGIKLQAVLNIQVPDEAVIKRLSGRRSCPGCGAVYHVEYSAPKQDGICDKCGTELIQRSDDQPEAIAKRLEEYAAKTAPLVAFYEEQGSLVNVPGQGSPAEVEEVIVEAVS
jgi:adenylate kinase